jgi:hypothetical protein
MKTKQFIISLMAGICLISTMTLAQKPVKGFQLSVVPFIGTDGASSQNHTYRFSLNLLAGITGGTDGFEAGGFLNINNGPMRGAQFSGFANFVQGRVEGIQGAGFMNVNSGSTRGVIGSGFANLISGTAEGLTGAGFINIYGSHYTGVSGAGFANVTGGSVEGVQGAGFANVIGGNVKGVMGSGFANITGGNYEGIQAAGFANFTGNRAKGLQVAGFMNSALRMEGLQVAGFMNIAKEMKGIQIGFLNIADTISGVPIGFLSIVKRGSYRQLEVSGSDVMHLGASFRIGVPVFYNIFSFGIRPFSEERNHGFGFGMGSNIQLSETSGFQIELHSTQLQRNGKWNYDRLDMLNEFRLSLGTTLGERIELFAGPVLYNHLYEENAEKNIRGSNLASYTIAENTWDDYTSKWWIGGRGGLRIKLN